MDDYQIEDGPCPHCGNAILHVKDCDVIGCEDGFIDEHDDDPINYAPGEELRECEECHGTGFVCWCPACGKDVTLGETVTHEFKPCPFCGCANIDEEDDVFYGFFCRSCSFGFTYEGCDNELQRSEVRAQWNSRPIEDKLRGENERMRDLLRSLHDRIGFILVAPYEVNTPGHLTVMSAEIESLLLTHQNEPTTSRM